MKRIKLFGEYLVALILIFLLLVTIISAIVVKFYGDELEAYTIQLINRELNTKFEVEEVGVSIFRKFPSTSVYLKNIYISSGSLHKAENFTDTLLFSEYVFLKINLISIIKEDIKVNSLELENVDLNICIDENGVGNYLFDTLRNNENELQVDFSSLSVENGRINYLNLAKQTESRFFIDNADISGNFSKQAYKFKSSIDGQIDLFEIKSLRYISNTDFNSELSANVDQGIYEIMKSSFGLGELNASIHGKVDASAAERVNLDIVFDGSNIDIEWLSDILNLEKRAKMKIDATGQFSLNGKIAGVASLTKTPDISISFSSKNSRLKTEFLPSSLESIVIRGSYTNGSLNSIESSSIIVDNFTTSYNESRVQGNFIITNLLEPRFKASIGGRIELSDLNFFTKDLNFSFIEGSLLPDITVTGKFLNLKSNKPSIEILPTGLLRLNQSSIELNGFPLKIHSVNGVLNTSDYEIKGNIKGIFGKTDVQTEMQISNILPYLRKEEKISMSGRVMSKNTDVEEIINSIKSIKRRKPKNKNPEDITLQLDLEIDNIKYQNYMLKDYSGSVTYNFPLLEINPFRFKSFDGEMGGSIIVNQLNRTPHHVKIDVGFQDIDINNLFTSTDNFGQDFLVSDNIAGNITGSSEVLFRIGPGYDFNTNDIVAESDITITNGELINFAPIVETYKFLDIENPQRIQFSKLQNTLIIKENAIRIPEMEINSSAINLIASGVHSFEKTFEYHLAIKLSELIYNKSKRIENREFNIAEDPDDERTVFLVLSDQGKGIKVDFDEEQAIRKVRNDIREERSELRTLFKEEFGRKDTISESKTKEKDEIDPVFKFEVNENDSIVIENSKKEKGRRWWQRQQKDDQSKKKDWYFVPDDE